MQTFRLLIVVILAVVFCCSSALAQEPLHRWEAGPLIGLEGDSSEIVTYGGRVTFNFNRWLATEIQITRTGYPLPASAGCCGGSWWQGAVHAKVSYRLERLNGLTAFGIAGPGFLSVSTGRYDPQYNLHPGTDGRFALNWGGGVEVPIHRRIALRADISDFMSRRKTRARPFDDPTWDWDNWADYKLGLMFRF